MKITGVEPFHISVPYNYGGPLQKADAIPWRNMETLLVKVTTDEGVTGWGEGFGFTICGTTGYAVTHAIAPLAVGRDPSDIAALTTDIARKQQNCSRNGPVAFALSALDIALWDIAGKIANQPLYRLLGGAEAVDRMPAYASLLRYGSVDLVERHSARAAEQGYARVKLHEIQTPQVAIARKVLGPDIKLMVDTNCPWTPDQAVAMAREFAPHDLLWLEEPVWPPEDYAALARVCTEGRVPVAAGECGSTFADFLQLIDTARVDYVQPSVTKIGGVTEMLRVIALARSRGTKVAPHSPYFGPGLLATMHVSASMAEKPPIERFYLELEASPLGDWVNARDGHMRVPQGPGLGVDIDEAVIAKYRVGVKSEYAMRKLMLVAAAFALGMSAAAAQVYPSRPITMVVPFPPGGPTDVLARIMAEPMRIALGQPVIIENVSGVGGATGSGRVARATPDGYQLVFSHMATHVILPATTPNLSYDTIRDFEPIALIADTPQGIASRASLPANDMKELIAWLKHNPGKATMGSIGVAGPSDISAWYFQQQTGTSFQLVPYRGGAPLMQDLIGGQIDMGIFQVAAFMEHVRSGKLRAYAILGKSRMATAPDVPTVDEVGIPGFYATIWHAIWAPKSTPKDVVAKLNAAVVQTLADPAVAKRFADLGQDIWPSAQQTPEALATHQKAEMDKWWPIIKAANIKAN